MDNIIFLLQLIIITSIWVLGVKIVTSDGMALEKWGQYGQKKIKEGHKIFEPLLICPWCMPSIHSLIGYLFALGIGVISCWQWKLLWMYPLCVMASSLICGLIWSGYMLMNSKKQYYDNAQEYYYHATKPLKKQNVKSS